MTMSTFNTVVEALNYYREKCGEDTPCYIFRDEDGGREVFTFGRMHRLAGRCAAYLRHKGIEKGSPVVVRLNNSPERLVCELGLLYAGAVCVNGMYYVTDGSDLIHCLRHSKASAILLDPDGPNSPWTPLQKVVQETEDGTFTSERVPHLKHVEFVRRSPGGNFLGYLDKLVEWYMEDQVQRSDDCFAFTTSGTTGLPKLVVHTHHHFVTTMEKWTRVMDAATCPRTVRYMDAPMGTSSGNLTVNLMVNETRVLCDEWTGRPQDRAGFIARCVQEERCSKVTLTPADVSALLQRVKRAGKEAGSDHTCSNNNDNNGLQEPLPWKAPVEQIALGGQPITGGMVDAALTLARTVLVFYGCTELGGLAAGLVTERGSYQDFNVGRLLPGLQVKVVDEQTGEPLPVGEIGQVLILHPIPFTEYLHDPKDPDPGPDRAAAFTDDGFYRTGDRGKQNADGSLTIFGRTGDTVITRGPGIYYPHVIESVVSASPGVADVVVVGVPDPLMGEEFCTCVVLEEGVGLKEVEEEVGRKLVGPGVTRFSLRPRYYLRFRALPRLATGRPDRRRIRQMAVDRLGDETTDCCAPLNP